VGGKEEGQRSRWRGGRDAGEEGCSVPNCGVAEVAPVSVRLMDVRCKGLFLPGCDSPEDAFEGLDASAHPDHHFKSFHMNLRKLISAV
jgi:hypothetical protein